MQLGRIGKAVPVALATASLAVGGVAFAGPGKSGDTKPGKGCGDKNHTHYKEDQCKKPPK
jgi:hypothetical protein